MTRLVASTDPKVACSPDPLAPNRKPVATTRRPVTLTGRLTTSTGEPVTTTPSPRPLTGKVGRRLRLHYIAPGLTTLRQHLLYATSPRMEFSRIDTKKLTRAIDNVTKLLDEALDKLGPHTVVLDETQRQTIVKPRDSFMSAAEAVMAEAKTPAFQEAEKFAGFDGAAVAEDLANIRQLARLETRLARLNQRLADTRLLWLAEAYAPMLELYAALKLKAKSDPELASILAPLVELFAVPRRGPAKSDD